MPASVDIVESDLYTAVGSFLQGILPAGAQITQGILNRVPQLPTGTQGYVVMTSAGMERIETSRSIYPTTPNPSTVGVYAPTRYSIQLDFYGPNSQSWASQTQALFRNSYAYDQFPANIKPLFADTPMQMPLVDAESQYEERWKLTAVLQYNPTVTVSQDYFATVNITTKEVDTTFPPTGN